MLFFNQSFVGGFFAFRRTYGATARFECGLATELEADWPATLRDTAAWRSRRGKRATALHLYGQVEPDEVWAAIVFLSGRLLVAPAARPPELRGLHLEVAYSVPPTWSSTWT